MRYLLIFLCSLVLAAVSTFGLTKLKVASVKEALDPRRVHTRPTPHSGGIAIFLAVLVALFIFVPLRLAYFRGLIAGALVIFFLGLLDDIWELPPWGKLIGQCLAAGLAMALGVKIGSLVPGFGQPVAAWFLTYPVTFLWLIGMVNAFNLIDGIDGLAAGVAAIGALTLAWVAVLTGNLLLALIDLSLAGAALGFLVFNFPPARIFMGDSGAMFLGYMLAALAVLGGAKRVTLTALMVPIVALGVPIIETIFTIWRRYRRGAPIFQADRDHLHHRLLALGWSNRRVVLIVYLMTAVLGVAAILMAQLRALPAGLVLLALFLIFWLVGRRLGILRYRNGRDGFEQQKLWR